MARHHDPAAEGGLAATFVERRQFAAGGRRQQRRQHRNAVAVQVGLDAWPVVAGDPVVGAEVVRFTDVNPFGMQSGHGRRIGSQAVAVWPIPDTW
jgi:hypothetical protein